MILIVIIMMIVMLVSVIVSFLLGLMRMKNWWVSGIENMVMSRMNIVLMMSILNWLRGWVRMVSI